MTAEELRVHDRRLKVLAEVLVMRCQQGGKLPRPFSDPDAGLEEVRLQLEAVRDAVYWRNMPLLYRALVRTAAIALLHLEEAFPDGPPLEDPLATGAIGYAPTVF